MEFISTSQLQKYEGIIEKIKREFERNELLKKNLEKENDNLILSQLANAAISQKLSHLNVQIFDTFTDLLILYGDELQNEVSNMLKTDQCKFYLIEIYITKSLMQKARGLKCLIHVFVRANNTNINKIVALRNKTPIREIILVDKDIINSTVEVNLLIPTDFKWIVIKLDTVHVDISYHFTIYKEKLNPEKKKKSILQITECYNEGAISQNMHDSLTLEIKLFCGIENDCFISTILKNCYHLLDLELFFELKNNADKEFVLNLSDGTEMFKLKFNRREKYLKLKGNIYQLCLLKKYFSKEFCKGLELQKYSTADVRKVMKDNEKVSQTPQYTCAFFCEVRECWSKLPI